MRVIGAGGLGVAGSAMLVLALAIPASGASAQERFDPGPERMGVSDRATTAGVQPRLWAVSIDDRLLSRAMDMAVDGWFPHTQTALTSDVDAISIVSGGTARQRAFYVRGGSLRMLNWDDDLPGSETTLPAAPATLSNSVSALGWIEGVNLRMAVAVEAASGRVCVWEGTIAAGFTLAPTCTAAGAMATTGSIDGAIIFGTLPAFFFVSQTETLVRMMRTSAGVWPTTDLSRPAATSSLGDGIAAIENVDASGRYEAIVEGSGSLWRCRLGTSESACAGGWGALPAMPGGTTASNSRGALAATRWLASGSPRQALFATTTSNRLVRLRSTSTAWNASWETSNGGSVIGPIDEDMWDVSVAVALPNGATERPTGYTRAGLFGLVIAEYGIQEYAEETNFRDHIRRNHDFVRRDGVPGEAAADVLGVGRPDPGNTGPIVTFDATESSTFSAGMTGLASAIRRNSPAPWEVVVSTTFTGGASWDDDWVVTPLPLTVSDPDVPRMSISDPYTAGLPRSGTLFHLGLEVPIENLGTGMCAAVPGGLRRLIIRSGSTAEAIAALDSAADPGLFVVDETDNLDHGQMVATVGAGGAADLHVVYNRVGFGIRYFRRTAGGTVTNVAVAGLPSGPPGAFAGDGTRVWAYGGSLSNPSVCQIFPSETNCGVFRAGSTSPAPLQVDVRFGPEGPMDETIGRVCPVPSSPDFRRCFDTEQPIAFTGSPTTTAVYAAYQADDPGDTGTETSIFFTRTTGSLTTAWRDAVMIRPRTNAALLEIQPSITLDHEGTIFVTFSEVLQDQTAPVVTQRIFVSTDDGVSFSEVIGSGIATWEPTALPLHCGRHTFFLGEYRDGARYGRRAFNLIHRHDGAGGHTLTGFWASRWARF